MSSSEAIVAELLEALKEAESLLEQTLYWREGWECSEEELLGSIRATIRKAERAVADVANQPN